MRLLAVEWQLHKENTFQENESGSESDKECLAKKLIKNFSTYTLEGFLVLFCFVLFFFNLLYIYKCYYKPNNYW